MVKQKGTRTYFSNLPTNTSAAKLNMFFKNGKPIMCMPYLIETIKGKEFHALRVGGYFTEFIKSDLFRVQLIRKRIYVFTKEDGSIRYK